MQKRNGVSLLFVVLKVILRSSVNQERLNHAAVMHVHQDLNLDIVDPELHASEFLSKCETRQLEFGDSEK